MHAANDNKTVFFEKQSDAFKKYSRHKLFASYKRCSVYQEEDNEFYTGVYRSKSGKFIIIWNSSTLVSDYHILKANDPDGNFSYRLLPEEKNMSTEIAHHSNKFYIMTNYNAKNNRLMVTPDDATDISTEGGHTA